MSKSIIQVQGTNDYSSVSKNSIVERGYFEDDFIKFFVRKSSRRSPLINVGYYVRAKIINFTFEEFLRGVAEQPAQIISLGAGFDTSFFRLLDSGSLHSRITYYEIDFREVVERKAAIIQATDVLSQAVGSLYHEKSVGVCLRSDRYCLLCCNLQDLHSLENILRCSGTNFSVPTLFLSECAITYMDETSSTALIKWAALKFEHGVFATYEQVYPQDAFGIVMNEHFKSLNSPLLSLNTFPDLESQEKRYKAQGWTACVSRSVLDVFICITDYKEMLRVLTLEPFDEFEEVHLKCLHYALTVAAKDPQNCLLSEVRDISQTAGHKVSVIKSDDIRLGEGAHRVNSELWRFAHRTAKLLHGDEYVVVGGVGVSPDGKHMRRAEVGFLNNDGSHSVCVQHALPVRLDVMHHTCTTLPNGQVLVVGGRTSPSQAVNADPFLLVPRVSDGHGRLTVDVETVKLNGTEEINVRKSRWRHTTVVISVGGCDLVLVFGGRTSSLEVLDELWVLDVLVEKSARQVQQADGCPWPEARCSHSAVACGTSDMIVAGGLSGKLMPLDDVWRLHGGTMTWHRCDVVMLPRYGHTSHHVSNRLILVGGVNMHAGKQPGIAIINTADWTCVEYSLSAQNPTCPLMLHNHCTELCDKDTILVIGGGGNCFSFGTAFNKYVGVITISNMMSQSF